VEAFFVLPLFIISPGKSIASRARLKKAFRKVVRADCGNDFSNRLWRYYHI
jgi:hypothetical protein